MVEDQFESYNKSALMSFPYESFDPDWQFATNHGKASRPGEHAENQQQTLVCPCCLHEVEKEPVPFCSNSKELEFIGFGYPLYYEFMKYGIMLLTLLTLSQCALGLYWAVQHNYDFCQLHGQKILNGHHIVCTGYMINIARVEQTVVGEEILVRFVSFGLHLLALIYVRNTLTKRALQFNERNTTLSDYSVQITNIPEQTQTTEKLKNFFKHYFNTPIEVEEVVLMADLKHYEQIVEEKKQLMEEMRKFMSESDKNIEQVNQIQEKINQKNLQLIKMYIQKKDLLRSDMLVCDKAIVTFGTEQIKDQVIDQFQMRSRDELHTYFDGDLSSFRIVVAPQPQEIIWENICIPKNRKLAMKILSWVASVFTLAVATVAFYFIILAKSHQVQLQLADLNKNDAEYEILKKQVAAAIFFIIFAVVLFNKFILAKLFHIFTDWERPNNSADFQFSFFLKYCIGLFFTTAIMTLLVEDISVKNIFSEDYGVLEEETIMFAFSSVVVPFIWLINPWAVWVSIRQWYYYGKRNLTQEEANKIMEPVAFSIGKRYAQLIQFFWFTFLYSSILPIGAPAMVFGISVYYFIDKWNLLRRASIKENVSYHIGSKILKLLDITLIMKPAGEMIFDAQIRDGISYESIVCLCIAGVYVLLPLSTLLHIVLEEEFNTTDKHYNETKHQFLENYHTLHPLFSLEKHDIINRGYGKASTTNFMKIKVKLSGSASELLPTN